MNSKQLAKIAGVSQSTVSRALNDSSLVSSETKLLIKNIAEENGFALNSQARSLKTQRTRTIGILFQEHFVDFTLNMYQSHIFNLIRKELQKSDYDVMTLFDNPYRSNRIEKILEVIKNKKVDGLLILRTDVKTIGDVIRDMGLPYVHILTPLNDKSLDKSLWLNFKLGGYKAGNYFARAGHKNIVVISSKEEAEIARDKTAGFQQALKEHDVELTENNIVYGDFSFESGYEVVNDNIEIFKKSTAVFSHNDAMALGAIEAFKEHEIRVPDDIEIIGHDNIPLSEWFKPYLSTVHIDSESIITDACTWLKKQINGDNDYAPEERVSQPKLLLRGTCSLNRINFDDLDEITL